MSKVYSRTAIDDATGVSFFDRIGGKMSVSDDNGASFLPVNNGGWPSVDCAFKYQTLAIARERAVRYAGQLYGDKPQLAAGMFTRVTGTDFDDNNFNATAGFGWTNASTQNTGYSGGVFNLSNSALFLNNKLPIIAHSHGEPWFARVRIATDVTTFTSGGFFQPLTLSNAAATHVIELIGNAASTALGLAMIDAAGSSGTIALSSDFTLGGDLMPIGAWFTLSMYFLPGVGLFVEASDVVNPANQISQANLDHLTDEPMVVYAGSITAARVDALAVAYSVAM